MNTQACTEITQTTCHCQRYEGSCFPPITDEAKAYLREKAFGIPLSWSKPDDEEETDNWSHCHSRISTSVQLVLDTVIPAFCPFSCPEYEVVAGLFNHMGLSEADIVQARQMLMEDEDFCDWSRLSCHSCHREVGGKQEAVSLNWVLHLKKIFPMARVHNHFGFVLDVMGFGSLSLRSTMVSTVVGVTASTPTRKPMRKRSWW